MSVSAKWPARRAVAVSVATVLAVTLCACGAGDRDAPASVLPAPARPAPARPASVPPGSVAVSVSIDPSRPRARVPRGFLGLSFEVSALPQIARYGRSGDFVKMLRSLGGGLLRFGGVSADTRTAWTDAVTPLPAWASSGLNTADLRDLGTLAAKSGWHVLLTLGLAHYDPSAAAREAAAAKAALGGWLAGIEIGNEPDAYARHGLRPLPWTVSRYDGELVAYRRAIARAAPGVALAAPDVSGSHAFATWGRGVAGMRPLLLTGHHYPLGCHGALAPTIPRLLSARVRSAEQASLRRYLSVSRASRIPLRLAEANTVSCGGRAGVSNTFASTLWAVDYIARAMVAGAAGINLQGAPANCLGYSPVCAPTPHQLRGGALIAQPEWYALLLARVLPGDRPVRAVVAPNPANVDVFALLGAHGQLHVVVVDDDPAGGKRATIKLRVGRRFGAASVLTLTGPSTAATAGIRLGGRAVERDGGFSAPAQLEQRPNRAGVVTLDVPPSSAMLVTVAPGNAPPG